MKGTVNVSQKEKLIKHMSENPQNVTFEDMKKLLGILGFEMSNKGKTSGSRVIFFDKNGGSVILHKPHPQKELKKYMVLQIIEKLKGMGYI